MDLIWKTPIFALFWLQPESSLPITSTTPTSSSSSSHHVWRKEARLWFHTSADAHWFLQDSHGEADGALSPPSFFTSSNNRPHCDAAQVWRADRGRLPLLLPLGTEGAVGDLLLDNKPTFTEGATRVTSRPQPRI